MSAVPGWVVTLHDLPASVALRESELLFPVLQTVHVLGVVLLFGGIAVLDLRLLRLLWPRRSPAAVVTAMLPVSWMGFAMLVASGLPEFAAQAVALHANPYLRAKLVLLSLALLNIALAHGTVFRGLGRWSSDASVPASARAFAAASLVLWSGVIYTGRMIAFT